MLSLTESIFRGKRSVDLKIPCSLLQGVFDCKELNPISDSLASPAASYGECARCFSSRVEQFKPGFDIQTPHAGAARKLEYNHFHYMPDLISHFNLCPSVKAP